MLNRSVLNRSVLEPTVLEPTVLSRSVLSRSVFSLALPRVCTFSISMALGLLLVGGSVGGSVSSGFAQTSQYVEQDGVTYLETRRMVKKPVSEFKTINQQETVYRWKPEMHTETRQQTVYVPVVQQQWSRNVDNWWNPLAEPRVTFRQVPVTYWVPQVRKYEVPVTRYAYQAETNTVARKVRVLQMVPTEVVSRVAVNQSAPTTRSIARPSAPPVAPAAAIATRPRYGGIQRIDSSSAHHGMTSSGNSLFR